MEPGQIHPAGIIISMYFLKGDLSIYQEVYAGTMKRKGDIVLRVENAVSEKMSLWCN